jgi:uncharacterized membrane protein
MLFLRPLWHCVWFLNVGLRVVLALLTVRRRLYRQFPTFVCYIGWTALESMTLLGMNYAPFVTGNEYLAAFTGEATISTVLRFAIIYEILQHLFGSYPLLRKAGITLFRGVTIVLLVTVVALAWFAPAAGEGHLMSGFFVLQRTVDALSCGLLLVLFAFPRLIGFSWRSQAFGIALGLGILASVSLATSAIRSQVEPIARNQTVEIIELIVQGTYLSSLLVWIAYLFMPERALRPVVKTLPEHDLETWNQELQRLLHQ